MPLSYAAGTLVEHRTCRIGAVAFDVSHLGTIRVVGSGAFDALQRNLTNDLARIGPGRAQYTHLLDDADGSVVDDLIVWWVGPEEFHVMANASNTTRVREAVGGIDITAGRAIIAVQGPEARHWLGDVAPAAAAVEHFRVGTFNWRGIECLVAGTGYTGEDGVECAVPVAGAPSFWEALLDAGILPAGLGARDTLRLEAGLPLHGHELGPGITPLQAGLEWVVAWNKPDFRGRAALEAEKRHGVERRLRGVAVQGRQPPRAGFRVFAGDQDVGEVTSGNFSPMLGHGIGLVLVPPDVATGAEVSISGRAQAIPGRITALPFVPRGAGPTGLPRATS